MLAIFIALHTASVCSISSPSLYVGDLLLLQTVHPDVRLNLRTVNWKNKTNASTRQS
jgi:hypothetical protein